MRSLQKLVAGLSFARTAMTRSILQSRLSQGRKFTISEISISRGISSRSNFSGNGNDDEDDDDWTKSPSSSFSSDIGGWDISSSWSTGLTKEHFDGEIVGRPVSKEEESDKEQPEIPSSRVSDHIIDDPDLKELEMENKKGKEFLDSLDAKRREFSVLMKQVREPGSRGQYLKDKEKAEMYRLHKENPELYTVDKLAKDFRIMRQRVHAILYLKEDEEKEEKKLGRPLDDSVELLLDGFPEFFKWHDREFHVASLPYKPDFKVMPSDWDGTPRDADEVHYEISMKEDQILYEEFVQRFNFNKRKVAGDIKVHKYSRRRSPEGWKLTIEKLGPEGKRGDGGGWKFVSLPDGSTRPLNELEKMFLKRETRRRRRKILP